MSTTTTVVETPRITAANIFTLFPDVETSRTPIHTTAGSDDVLDGYDEEQIRLMDEVCIVLDEDDLPIGSASKKVCKLQWSTTLDVDTTITFDGRWIHSR